MTVQEIVQQIRAGTPWIVTFPTDRIDAITIRHIAGDRFDVFTEDSPIYVLNPINIHEEMTEERVIALLTELISPQR